MNEYTKTTGYYYDPNCLFQLFGDSSALFSDEYQPADFVFKQSKFASKLLTKIGDNHLKSHDDFLNNYDTVTFPWPHARVGGETNIPVAIIDTQKEKKQYTQITTGNIGTHKQSPKSFSKDEKNNNSLPVSPARKSKGIGDYLISLPKRILQAKEREQQEVEERLQARKKFEKIAKETEILKNGIKMAWTQDGRCVSEDHLNKMQSRKVSYVPPYQYEQMNMASKKKISISKISASIDKKCQSFVEAKKEYLRKARY